MLRYLDFEKPVADLMGKVQELRAMATDGDAVGISDDIQKLEIKADEALKDIYSKLTPWQKTQVARHPDRPHFVDYLDKIFTEFTPLAGDRKYSEDEAIIAGLGRLDGRPVAIMGHERGFDTESRLQHNFGSARPEGYRKAVRIMEMADRFGLPVISLVDTAGAYPGVGAEERGQAEAIARSTDVSLGLKVPNIAVVIGEGGSGGALAIATCNAILMLENSIYGVISPEGAASILWRDSARAKDAAASMKITAQDLIEMNVIDEIIGEPNGGAHRGRLEVISSTGAALKRTLASFDGMSGDEIKAHRHKRFMELGSVFS